MDDADVLELPLYSVTEAGRLLGLAPVTLKRWLEGYSARGTAHPPIIRPERTGSDAVTWGEFVEAGWLREYRTRMPLQKLRPLVDRMRERFQVKYPLAHFQPFVDLSSKEAVDRIQSETGLPEELYLVRWVDDQLQWSAAVEGFLDKVEFDPLDAVARRMYPLGREVPIAIDPKRSFGVPQIRGVRTETIVESLDAGATPEAVARMWGMDPQEVEAARTWERRLKAA
ncbi:MAG: DUF433 domain-containing protein [Actinomycetota bacterium]